MLEALNNSMLSLMDVLLGWMLSLPTDVALVIVAVSTAAILTLVRPFTTNQDLLHRCKNDKKQLKTFIREAKRNKDKEAIQRYRSTMGQIAMKTVRAEGMPLLIAIVPVALLAVWCFGRLGFVAPTAEAPVTVRAYFPSSSIDGVVHVMPADGLTAQTGWMQRITADPNMDPSGNVNGWATWELSAQQRPEPHTISFRYRGKTYTKEMLVDGSRYSPVISLYDESALNAVQLDLKPYKPLT